jgi:hypothetical protein
MVMAIRGTRMTLVRSVLVSVLTIGAGSDEAALLAFKAGLLSLDYPHSSTSIFIL